MTSDGGDAAATPELLRGEGVFDVASFINAVHDLGWAGPSGVEHMSNEFRELPIRDALSRARDGVLSCFAEADQRLMATRP